MKRSCVLAGTLALIVMMFASVGFAAACHVPTPPPPPRDPIEYYPTLEIKQNGMIWYFQTMDDSSGAFNGMKVIKHTVEAYYFDADGNGPYTLDPVAIVTTKNWVMLVFNPRSLPTGEASASGVTGDLTNGDNFIASGPGFTWGRH